MYNYIKSLSKREREHFFLCNPKNQEQKQESNIGLLNTLTCILVAASTTKHTSSLEGKLQLLCGVECPVLTWLLKAAQAPDI